MLPPLVHPWETSKDYSQFGSAVWAAIANTYIWPKSFIIIDCRLFFGKRIDIILLAETLNRSKNKNVLSVYYQTLSKIWLENKIVEL